MSKRLLLRPGTHYIVSLCSAIFPHPLLGTVATPMALASNYTAQMGRFDRFLNPGVAEVVGGGPAEAFHGHRADVQRDVTVGHVLMDGPACEPGETQGLCAEVDVGLLGLGIVQGFLDQGFSYLPF